MDRKERFNAAFDFLRSKGIVRRKKDVAIAMHRLECNVSRAFSGNAAYLTDNFLTDFNQTFGDVFRLEWLLNGEEPMLDHEPSSPEFQTKLVDGTTSALLRMKDKKIQELLDEINELRKRNFELTCENYALRGRVGLQN